MSTAFKEFDSVFVDCSSGSKRLKKDSIFDKGALPVVDQGKKLITGYTNDEEALCNVDLPVVIFGDHTRAFKYVDFPFAVGADGVKILRPKNGDDEKFLFYQCLGMDIEDNGYSRHFKFLKRKFFYVPDDVEEQRRIAGILDQADALRQSRRRAITRLNDLSQSIFYEMFGDPTSEDNKQYLEPLGKHTTKIGSGATPKGGDAAYKKEGIPLIRSMNVRDGFFTDKGLAFLDDDQAAGLKNVIVEYNDVLLNITGASVARVCRAPKHVIPARVNQHVAIIRPKGTILAEFLESQLLFLSMKNKLLNIAEAGATRQAITKSQIESLDVMVPAIEQQKEYLKKVHAIEKQSKNLKEQESHFENLFLSLQQRAFRGGL